VSATASGMVADSHAVRSTRVSTERSNATPHTRGWTYLPCHHSATSGCFLYQFVVSASCRPGHRRRCCHEV